MKLRYWRNAIVATLKFPYLWYTIWKWDRDSKARIVGSFFMAFQAVGFQWEIAIKGFSK